MVNNLITMVKQKSYPAPSGAGFSATTGHTPLPCYASAKVSSLGVISG